MTVILNRFYVLFLKTLYNFHFILFRLGYFIYYPKVEIVAFQTSLTKTLENLRRHQTVIFDKVLLNEGNAYSKASGIFTAPSDGIYSFTWTMSTKYGKYFVTEIVWNYEKVAYNQADGRGHNGWPMSTSHAYIKMKKGEKVWIRAQGNYGHFAYGGHWCSFSGAKL